MSIAIKQPVPTNIITGFLGAGKTTAILSLLQQKPAEERWAVLVNEFGEVGIDGGLIASAKSSEETLFIGEVPGGCMCCAAGLPMQVALNRLLQKARPTRLLIEPTGLGHPLEVIKTLQKPENAAVLSLQTVITLVDARKIDDRRYTDHEVFRQQLEVADLIVANKTDLYEGDEVGALTRFLDEIGLGSKPVQAVTQGALALDWLQQPHADGQQEDSHLADPVSSLLVTATDDASPLTSGEFIRKEQEQVGFFSVGWRIAKDHTFERQRLYLVLAAIEAERTKAVVRTDQGVEGFNMADGMITTVTLDQADESRIEIVSRERLDGESLELQLRDALVGEGA